MVFIDAGDSQRAFKAAQSGCPGGAEHAGGQQKQEQDGVSVPATSAAWWPVLPIKCSVTQLPVSPSVLTCKPVSLVPWLGFFLFSFVLCLSPLARMLAVVCEQCLQVGRGAGVAVLSAFVALTLSPQQGSLHHVLNRR